MERHWGLVVADFRREYHMSAAELHGLDAPTFWLLLRGLTPRSRFHAEWRAAPKHLYDPDEIAAVTAQARR
jgi:hypothetical protein